MNAVELPSALDRIVFATTDTGWMHVVASSMGDDELAAWTELLRDHVAVDARDQPPESLWYSSDGGGAALLRRTHRVPRGADGGDRCHALVGWHQDLTPELALRLYGWVGWTGLGWSRTRLRRLDLASSRFEYARPRDLDRAAVGQRSSLVPLVAAVLRDPHRPISVVSPPTGLASRTALLWGLRAVVGDLLDVPGEPPFTFSTFEARHTAGGSAVPRFAFLPPDAPDVFPASHRVVRLPALAGRDTGDAGGSSGRDDAYTHAAVALVSSYATGGADAVRDWLDQRRVRASNSVADRVERVLDTVDALRPPAPPGPAGGQANDALGTDVPASGGPADGARASDGPTDGVPLEGGSVNQLADLAQLPDADPEDVRRVVRSLVARRVNGADSRADSRDARADGRADARRADAREVLLRDGTWEHRLAAALPPADVQEAVDAVVRFAFLPDLCADEVACQVAWLVATLDASSLVLGSLLRLVVGNGRHAILVQAAGERWLREHGHPVAEVGPPPLGRPRSQPWERADHAYLHLLYQGGTASRSRASRDG